MASASLAGFSMTGWKPDSFRPQLPLPPVTYPPLFGKGLNFRYFMQSKILALAFLIYGICFLVTFVCAFLPFWFVLNFNLFDSTFGSEGARLGELKSDTGIIFFTADQYSSLIFLEKASNRQVVPALFKVAQISEILSVAVVGCCLAGSAILAFRKYSSVTGVLFLAALGTIGALGQILMVVFSMLTLVFSANDVCETSSGRSCDYMNNLVWRNLPFNQQIHHLNQHTTPKIEANWGLYIACIGAALSIGGCVLLWLEGMMVCKAVSGIRYQQLKQKRDVHEGERHPTDFIFSPPSRGPPPVTYSAAPMDPASQRGRFVPARQTYRPPPSVSGSSMQSGSAPYVSREVDL